MFDYFAEESQRLSKRLAELKDLANSDPSLITLIAEEVAQIEKAQANLLIVKEKAEEKKNVNAKETISAGLIVEIRAGAGGDESALFAGELAEMYHRYAEGKGWVFVVVSESKAELGGYKEVIFEVAGEGAYDDFCYETGVDRV